jgi:hypothetical protein
VGDAREGQPIPALRGATPGQRSSRGIRAMNIRPCLRAVAAVATALALASLPGAAFADGVPVMPWFAGGQHRPGLAPDGAGGAWVAFKTDTSLRGIVRLAASGLANPAWPNGVYPSALGVTFGAPTRVLANSPDRVYVVSDYCVYDQLVMGFSASGDTAEGFPVSSTLFYPEPGAALGPDGRVMVAVPAVWGGNNRGIRYAMVSPLGETLSEAELSMGVQVINSLPFSVISDGANGMIVGVPCYYTEDFTSGIDFVLQRVASDGTLPWTSLGKLVCAVNGNQQLIRMWPDGFGGALVTWTDPRTSPAASPFDIYAARFTSTGALATGWTAQGKRVTTSSGGQFESRVVDDGAGGAWIMWRDERVPDIDLYYTHMTGNGLYAAGFSGLGTLLCGAAGNASDPQMAPDGAGGFYAVWVDPRNGNSDIFGTHITSAGTPAAGWPANGLALCDDPEVQTQPVIVATGGGNAMVAWRDGRGTGGNVYALALGPGGPSTTDVTPGPASALRLRAAVNPSFGLSDLWVAAPAGARVDVALVDVAGRAVRSLSLAGTGAEARARFAGGPLPAGIYFATARSGPHRATLRLCILN